MSPPPLDTRKRKRKSGGHAIAAAVPLAIGLVAPIVSTPTAHPPHGPMHGHGDAATVSFDGQFDEDRARMFAHFVDVGQANACILEFPCAAVLIDAGVDDV